MDNRDYLAMNKKNNVKSTERIVIKRLKEIQDICYSEANKNIGVENNLFEQGKMSGYSHIYFELKNLETVIAKKDIGFINWKIVNLVLGFALGGLFVLYSLNVL